MTRCRHHHPCLSLSMNVRNRYQWQLRRSHTSCLNEFCVHAPLFFCFWCSSVAVTAPLTGMACVLQHTVGLFSSRHYYTHSGFILNILGLLLSPRHIGSSLQNVKSLLVSRNCSHTATSSLFFFTRRRIHLSFDRSILGQSYLTYNLLANVTAREQIISLNASPDHQSFNSNWGRFARHQ